VPLPVLYRVRILSGMITLLAVIGVVAAVGLAAPSERDRRGDAGQHVSWPDLSSRG